MSATTIFQNVFSIASRERCMKNFKKFNVPLKSKSSIDLATVPTAAVLVPLVKTPHSTSILYTLRSANLKRHSGQIAFPGGKTDQGETPIETALRETEEEIGLSRVQVDVWGAGPQFPGKNSQIMITPVIGSVISFKQENLTLNKNEVSEVFTVPLEILCDPKNHFYTQFQNGLILPVFVANGFKIWGFSAILTHVFLASLLPKEVYSNNWLSKRIDVSKYSSLKQK